MADRYSLDLAIFFKNMETAEFTNKTEIDETEHCFQAVLDKNKPVFFNLKCIMVKSQSNGLFFIVCM